MRYSPSLRDLSFIHLTEEAHNVSRPHLGFPVEIFDIRGTALSLHIERFPKPLGLQDGYMTIIETLSICTSFHLRRSLAHVNRSIFQATCSPLLQRRSSLPYPSIAATRIDQGDEPHVISNYKWIHGNVMLWVEGQQYGSYLTWIKLVQILQGMASFCEQRGFWAAIIDVMENEKQQISRVSLWTSR